MQWSEVRERFPDQFVLVRATKSHQDGNQLYVDEMSVIRPITDAREATRELLSSKNDDFVYHTARTCMVMEVVERVGFRRHAIEDNTN